MVQQSNGAVATAPVNPEYARGIEAGGHTVGLVYPGTAEYVHRKPGENFIERIRVVTIPQKGYEEDLRTSTKILQDPEHDIGDILRYLPTGTLAIYRPQVRPNAASNQIPTEIGVADEVVGTSLDAVVRVIKLWLERKAEKIKS